MCGAWDPISVCEIVTGYNTGQRGTCVSGLAKPVAAQSIWPPCDGEVVAHIRTKWHTTVTPNWHTEPLKLYRFDTKCRTSIQAYYRLNTLRCNGFGKISTGLLAIQARFYATVTVAVYMALRLYQFTRDPLQRSRLIDKHLF